MQFFFLTLSPSVTLSFLSHSCIFYLIPHFLNRTLSLAQTPTFSCMCPHFHTTYFVVVILSLPLPYSFYLLHISWLSYTPKISHMHSLFLSNSRTFFPIYTHSLSYTLSLSHKLALSHKLVLSHTLNLSHIWSISLTCARSLSHTLTLTLTFFLALTISLSHPHAFSDSSSCSQLHVAFQFLSTSPSHILSHPHAPSHPYAIFYTPMLLLSHPFALSHPHSHFPFFRILALLRSFTLTFSHSLTFLSTLTHLLPFL